MLLSKILKHSNQWENITIKKEVQKLRKDWKGKKTRKITKHGVVLVITRTQAAQTA